MGKKLPIREGMVHRSKLGILMSPAPKDATRYQRLRDKVLIRPFAGKIIPQTVSNMTFDIGREPEMVNLPVSFFRKTGVTGIPSKVHGTLSMGIVRDANGEWVHNIEYTDIGRGTAIFEMPARGARASDILANINQAKPHPVTPHMQLGSAAERGVLKVKPNKTVMVFGVHPDTIRDQHLTITEYEDFKGRKVKGFMDEFGNIYPWMMITERIPREKAE